eukprot:XP_001704920.1 Hypothetical protein GL50803_19870 [Giardia lamblia ATCC 50803]
MDSAPDFGSGGCGFKSRRVCFVHFSRAISKCSVTARWQYGHRPRRDATHWLHMHMCMQGRMMTKAGRSMQTQQGNSWTVAVKLSRSVVISPVICVAVILSGLKKRSDMSSRNSERNSKSSLSG